MRKPKTHVYEIMNTARTECGMAVRDHTLAITRFDNRDETRATMRSFGTRFCAKCKVAFER